MPLGAWCHGFERCVEGWSDCLRLELKQFNIDVVIIEPGIIATGFGNALLLRCRSNITNNPQW